jgi:hypothetical protein
MTTSVRNQRRSATLMLLAATAIAALWLTSAATLAQSAEKGEHGRHSVNANKNRHCVTDLSKPDAPTTCYDTFTAAIAAATRGRVTDAPADSRKALKDERFMARVYNTPDKEKETIQTQDAPPQARIFGVVGTIFYDENFDGSSRTWSQESCDDFASIDWEVSYVGDDWNDDFQSAKGGNNCQMRVFEHSGFGGASTPWFWENPWLGVLEDEGSSLQFR